MAKCVCECKKGLPLWLGTFGDLMSLLLCFFVLLLSMATFDASKLSEAEGAMRGSLSALPGGTKTDKSRERVISQSPMEITAETAEVVHKIENTILDYEEMLMMTQGASSMMDVGDQGFIIRLPSSITFSEGSDRIEDQDTLLFLRRIGQIAAALPNDVDIFVNGHTNNLTPPKESFFKNNWQLSGARAIAVTRELASGGINPKKITPIANGEHKPLVTNDTKDGREKNSRVEIYFYGKKRENQPKKSILDGKSS